MARNPLFIVKFDVKSSDNYGDLRTERSSVGKEQASIKKKNYGDFIACLRRRLSNPKHFSHNCPVLPPVVPDVPPRRWFHVVLETQTSALTLATRADNLYLEGFQSSDGTWWKLTDSDLIPRATYVGFGGTYRDLLGDTDKLVDVALGPQEMTDAVNVLAARTKADLASGPKQQRARDALVALLLMVHEATRFLTVSKKVSDLMHPRAAIKSGKITSQMKEQVNGWKKLSIALLGTDVALKLGHGQSVPGRFTPFENMGVMTAEKAAETVGILLFVDVPGGMTTATALKLFRES